jgi:hypothetical protein
VSGDCNRAEDMAQENFYEKIMSLDGPAITATFG